MKSFLGLLLMVAAPLAAQTPTPHTIVFKVVLTTVTSSPVQPPDNTGQPPVVVPDPPSGPPTDPSTDSSTPSDQGSTNPPAGCGGYSDAVTAMDRIYASLIYTQQLYKAAQTVNPADPSTYYANNDALVKMQLHSQDIRDIIRVGGPPDIIAQGVAAVSSDIAMIPALLSGNKQLPLDAVIADMQARLTNVSKLVNAASCAESVR